MERGSDSQLVQRFQTGDRDAFSELYRRHQGSVFRFALYLTGDAERAGEITQEVFVWLIHHPDAFDPERGDLGPFLGGVARQFLRRQRREDARWVPLVEHRAPSGVPPEVAGDGESEELWRAIASLPEAYREAVILCDLEELSGEQAAEALGCAVGTVWSRLHRAHDLLLRKLSGKQERQRCSI